MIKLTVELFVLAIFVFVTAQASCNTTESVRSVSASLDLEDAHLTVGQLIKKYGYRGEKHKVVTADGYILEMHRITGPNSNPSPNGKQPILLVHALLSSSVDWIMMGPGKAFGYILADEGYDVWMGNVRGNKYSSTHKKYSKSDKKYWQFSWHEMGTKDLPAMIDYILLNTRRQQLLYAGHSQGTTAFWVMAAERPEYQDKVKAMFALAPVAYLEHTRSPFYRAVSKFANTIDKLSSLLGYYAFEPMSDFVRNIATAICKNGAWTQPACKNIIFLIAGIGSEQFNTTMLPVIVNHLPAGSSTKQVIHFLQGVKSRKFQQYDHGMIGNLMKYKQLHPPVYNLAKIKVPVSLHYGHNDALTVPKDVDRLYTELGNPIGKFRVPLDSFTHLDFQWAIDGKKLLYDKIIALMKRYSD